MWRLRKLLSLCWLWRQSEQVKYMKKEDGELRRLEFVETVKTGETVQNVEITETVRVCVGCGISQSR